MANQTITPTPTNNTSAGGQPPIVLQDGTQLDPGVVKVMKVIKTLETGGSSNPWAQTGDNGSSLGAYQWNNGNTPIAPGQTPINWQNDAQTYLGNSHAQMTPANQNLVAYSKIKHLKDEGYQPSEIDAMWNGAHKDESTGLMVHNNITRAQQFNQLLAQQVNPAPVNNPLGANVAEASDGSTPAPTTQGPSVGGFIENAAGSAANLVGGLANAALHPIDTASNVIGSAAGGIEKLFGANNGDTQKFDNVVGYFKNRYGGDSLSQIAGNIGHTLYTDPVGAALDVSTLLDGVGAAVGAVGKVADVSRAADIAKAADMIKGAQDLLAGNVTQESANTAHALGSTLTPGTATQVGTGIKTAAEYSNPLTPVISGVTGAAGLAGKAFGYTASKFIGEDPAVLADLIRNPQDYSKAVIAEMDRGGLAQEFGDAIDSVAEGKSATGGEYGNIVKSGATASITAESLKQVFADAGITATQDLDKAGNAIWKLSKPGADTTLSSSDVAKFEEVLNRFGQDKLTAGQLLNAKQYISKNLANYEGKTSASTALANKLRSVFEDAGDKQIPGLKELDAKMRPQINLFNKLKKEFLTYDPQAQQYVMKDGAANKIANALKKPELLKTMEQIAPGISRKIEILKNVEAIEASKGIKVATYGKSIAEGGAVVTGNIPLAAAMIIAHPSIANEILRGFGYVSKAAIIPVLTKVRGLLGALPVMTATKVGIEANKTQ